MAVTRADTELALKLAAMARLSPQTWAGVVAEFRKRTDRMKDQCVQSTPGDLLMHQGRARESMDILQLMEECIAFADRMAGKK